MAQPSRNLGIATDVALMVRQGSTLTERDDHWTLTTPANPAFHWGNFIILREAPEHGSLAGWLETFRAEHPTAAHVAIAIDARDVSVDPSEAAGLGLDLEHDIVLSADRLAPQEHPPAVECRLFDVDDADAWEQAVELDVANQPDDESDGYRTFTRRRLEGLRALQRDGTGGWFGAFDTAGALVGDLGIYAAGNGFARFQNVLTDAAHRRRGIAGALVRAAGQWAFTHLGAHTLVIVAEATGPAIALYRSVGLRDTHSQTSLYAARAALPGEPGLPTA